MRKKDFLITSQWLVSIVDFVKWTSSFGEGDIRQMETPLTGVQLAPALSDLFAIGIDETGPVLAMNEDEGSWLTHLPIECAFIGFEDNLILCTEPIDVMEVPFERVGISIFIASVDLRKQLAEHSLLGFGLIKDVGPDEQKLTRVNKIVPLYNPATYEARKADFRSSNRSSLFAS